MREVAYPEIAERLKKSGKTNVANIQNLLEPYLFPYFFQHLNVAIISPSDAWGEQSCEFWVKTTYPCDPVDGGWKNFRKLLDGGGLHFQKRLKMVISNGKNKKTGCHKG